MPEFSFMNVNATGVQVIAGGTTARVALPVNAAGKTPKHVRIQCTGNAYIRPGDTNVNCTVNDVLISPNYDVYMAVGGFTHMAYLQEFTAAKINITPLET